MAHSSAARLADLLHTLVGVGSAVVIAVTLGVASPSLAHATPAPRLAASQQAAAKRVAQWIVVDRAAYRKGPGTSYAVAGRLWKGTKVTGAFTGTGWFKRANGTYLPRSALTGVTPGTLTRYVAGAKANYRTGPSTGYKVVGSYTKGKKMTGIESANGWLRMGSGYYISGAVLRTTPAPPPTTRWVTVAWANSRSGPSTGYRVVGRYWKGTKVGGRLTSGGWLRMTNGRYISGAVLTAKEPRTVTRYVTADTANYRSGPGTGYAVKGTYRRGTKVTGTMNGRGWMRINASGFHISGTVLRTTPLNTTNEVTQHVAVRWGDVYTRASTSSTRIDYAPRDGLVKGTVTKGWVRIGAHRFIRMAQLTTNRYAYTGANGRISPSKLCHLPIPGKEHRFIRCGGARTGMKQLDAAFRARFGQHLEVDECYRTYGTQVFYRQEMGTKAAVPGYSNHGRAVACDVSGDAARYGYGTPREQWLVKQGPKYGWVRPAFMDEGGSNPEFWHFEYVG